jgi:hypothetical protein
MKNILFAAFIAIASPAFSATSTLIAAKVQNSGHTLPEALQSFKCSIYTDRVEIDRSYGSEGATVKETRPVTISENITKIIEKSSQEEFIDKATLCDAPATEIAAYQADGTFPLLSESTCNQDGSRHGPSSTVLTNLINSLCGSM